MPILMPEDIIAFTKVKLPYGWLGNMSPYSVLGYRTAEHLFQALRFDAQSPIRDELRALASPMAAKMHARQHDHQMILTRCSEQDLQNMCIVLEQKLQEHPSLAEQLVATGDKLIIEDVTRRASKGSAMFWGAALINGKWRGENRLGRCWMDLRERLQKDRGALAIGGPWLVARL